MGITTLREENVQGKVIRLREIEYSKPKASTAYDVEIFNEIEYGKCSSVVFDCPSKEDAEALVKAFKKHT